MTSTPLPDAVPEDVGLSTAGLARLGSVMRGEIERGRGDPRSPDPMARDSIFRIYSMTKPIVSVAAMMLWEQGRFLLSDPIEKYLPELGRRQVAVVRGAEIELVDAERPITIQDLLRHTSGLTYEFRGGGPVHKMYTAERIYSRNQSNADQVATLGKLPLIDQPGTKWEY